MSTQHTLGPWQCLPEESDKDYIRIRGTQLGRRYKIANVPTQVYVGVHEREIAETRANARLIAAAPDLLEALQALFANMLAQDLVNEAKRPTEGEFIACMAAANAAIAKATGGQA